MAREMAISHFSNALPGELEHILLSEPPSKCFVWGHFYKEQNRTVSVLEVSATEAQPCLGAKVG